MRVLVAGAQTTHVEDLLQTLPATLPPSVTCSAWNVDCSATGHALTADDVVLLLGLGPQGTHDPVLTLADETLRTQLMSMGVSFQVIHGDANQHLQEAQHAVAQRLRPLDPERAARWMREDIAPRWQGVCDACSDPDCEHRLFRRLIAPNASLD